VTDRAGLANLIDGFKQAGFDCKETIPPERFLLNPLADPENEQANASIMVFGDLTSGKHRMYHFQRTSNS
jgi:hypothetical protein